MQGYFTSILIPVDFSVNTEVAVYKALQIADGNEVYIHLLHVCRQTINGLRMGKIARTRKEIEAEIKLKEWQETIKDQIPAAKVDITVISSLNIQNTIIWYALQTRPDLVVIGKKKTHSILPFLNTVTPTLLSKKMGIPVLAVKPGSLHHNIKNVIVPVTDQPPFDKIEVIKSLCRKNRIKIFLVTFVNGKNIPENYSPSSLIKIHQWLKSTLHCQTEYSILLGNNKVKAILQFAEENNADILLLNPGSETSVGWPGKYISDIIPRHSKVQVLTVLPAQYP